MKHRWTIKEINSFSDTQMLSSIVSERISELHLKSPLAERLKAIREKLRNGRLLN